MAADISQQIKQIESASRGEDVRDAIVDALNAIKDFTAGGYDTNTTYTFSYADGVLTITPSEGNAQKINVGGGTDYTFTLDNGIFTVTPKNGTPQAFNLSTIDQGYSLALDGNVIKLMKNDTEISQVDISGTDGDVMSTYY